MKKNIFFLLLLLTIWVNSSATISAAHLDGLWRNDRQNITIRIEEDQDGFRAKRTDRGVWYHYTYDGKDIYVDKRGNWYEVIHEDQMEWNEVVSRKKILFNRVESRDDRTRTDRTRNEDWDNDSRTTRGHDEDWDTDYDRRDRDDIDRRTATVEGRWYDKRSKERLIIEESTNGYRVRTQHGSWEKYTSDRNGQRLRSRNGDIIQVVDRNTLRWRSDDGRSERIFVRQGNGQVRDNGNANRTGHHKEKHNDSHHKEKHSNSCKKHCG